MFIEVSQFPARLIALSSVVLRPLDVHVELLGLHCMVEIEHIDYDQGMVVYSFAELKITASCCGFAVHGGENKNKKHVIFCTGQLFCAGLIDFYT